MIYLVIAVLCSVSVSILLKVLRQQNIDIRQTIAAGYPVAFLLTGLLLKPDLSTISNLHAAWAIILALGVLLPSVFIMLGRAIASAGIVATDSAQRLSLIIPILSAFLLFGEALTQQRILGVGLGFLALIALLYRPQPFNSTNGQNQASVTTKHSTILSLLGVWLGYGVIDILFKQVAKQGTAFSLTLFLSFGLAGILLTAYLLLKRINWQSKAVAYGVLLGMLNMGNIYAYVKAHQTLSDSPSIVFTGMNVGVIALASVVGVLAFKERLSLINYFGLLMAISCVVVLFLG